ncbi:MAG: hypothetical protein JO154_22315 [Chitinophaga sp.]|uniref:MbnP family protein n=1 Tax=Chitinophaga sp. TaxID=1869181 RepID=UPI0025C48C07|nr:MbnP family protein [Chitinophaga sp.]MBV8255352.1 hypothetical protein [Chitinophaga sp.]
MILRIFYAWLTILLSGTLLVMAACSKSLQPQANAPITAVHIQFNNYVGNVPLQLNAGAYMNTAGEQYTVSKFLYYVSNFQLTDINGKTITLPQRYFLVDQATDSTKKITLDSVPVGQYTAIKWTIGVDSIRNVSGVQAGALAPENGMFWTWNSGYIMAKMEGHSPQATTALNVFLFHIGGFKQPYNALKTISITLPSTLTAGANHQAKINIKADADKWFHTPNTVSIAQSSIIMAAGVNAMAIAENYQQMFSVMSIAN